MNSTSPSTDLKFDSWFHKLLPNSSDRIPDWRWNLAIYLETNPPLPRRLSNDPDIKLARKLYKYLRKIESSKRIRVPQFPDGLLEAYRLYNQSPYHQAPLKAHFLSARPIEEIAHLMNIPLPALTYFERLFFNITDRIQATSYIFHHILDRASRNPQHPFFLSAFYMELAYFYGPFALDRLLEYGERLLEPLTPKDLQPTDDPTEKTLRTIKLFILAHAEFDTPPIDQLNFLRTCLEIEQREHLYAQDQQKLTALDQLTSPITADFTRNPLATTPETPISLRIAS